MSHFSPSGQLLDCSLAKADKKDENVAVPASKGGPLLPSYTPLGYGLAGGSNPLGKGLAGAYNPLGNGLAGAYGVLPTRAAQVHDIIYYALATA